MIVGIDTNILSSFFRNDNQNKVRKKNILQFLKDKKVELIKIPTIVLGELYSYATNEEFESIKKTLSNHSKIQIISFDEISAYELKLFNKNKKLNTEKSRQIAKTDNLICACCKAHNCDFFLTTDRNIASPNHLLELIQVDDLYDEIELFEDENFPS